MRKSVSIFVVILIALGLFYYFDYGRYISTKLAYLEPQKVDQEHVSLEGEIVGSAIAYTGYSYEIIEDELIIRLRGALVSPVRRSGQINIQIKDNFEEIKKITFEGKDNEDKKVIWELD